MKLLAYKLKGAVSKKKVVEEYLKTPVNPLKVATLYKLPKTYLTVELTPLSRMKLLMKMKANPDTLDQDNG